MSLSQAFGITEEDLAAVLRQNSLQVANTNGVSFDAMAETIFNDWSDVEFDRVASAALDGGVEMDDQTSAAYSEIRSIFVEQGVLKR